MRNNFCFFLRRALSMGQLAAMFCVHRAAGGIGILSKEF
jgi:hypothetical protein